MIVSLKALQNNHSNGTMTTSYYSLTGEWRHKMQNNGVAQFAINTGLSRFVYDMQTPCYTHSLLKQLPTNVV